MKRFILIMLFISTPLFVVAQDSVEIMERRVSIIASNEPVKAVLKRLEKLGKFNFAYSPEAFNVNKKISIDAKEKSLKKILEEVFNGEEVEWKAVKNKIFILKRKDTRNIPSQSNPTQQSVGGSSDQPVTRKIEEELAETAIGSVKLKDSTRSVVSGLSVSEASIDEEPDTPAVVVEAEKTKLKKRLSREISEVRRIQKLSTGPSEFLHYGAIKQEPTLTRIRPEVVYEWPEDNKKEKAPRERKPKEEKKFRIYGASTTAYSRIADKGGIIMGGRGALMLNKRFGIGLAGYAFQTGKFADIFLSQSDFRYSGGYGGFLLEYTIAPDKPVHVSFPVIIGAGGAVYSQNQLVDNKLVIDAQAMFVMEPGVELEINLIKFVKVSFGATYRMTTSAPLVYEGGQQQIVGGDALNGWTAGCTVKFGIF